MTAANEITEATPAQGRTKPILDTETGKEYSSMYKAGQDLASIVGGDPKNRLVWFSIARKYPTRFKTKSTTGEWVALDDPSVPVITRVKRTETLDERRARLLAELGEVEALRAAQAANGSNGASAEAEATAADASDEVVEEEAAKPTPGPAKGKLAAAMTAKK